MKFDILSTICLNLINQLCILPLLKHRALPFFKPLHDFNKKLNKFLKFEKKTCNYIGKIKVNRNLKLKKNIYKKNGEFKFL